MNLMTRAWSEIAKGESDLYVEYRLIANFCHTIYIVLPIASLLWVSKVSRRVRRTVLSAAILMWLVPWIMAIVASEALLIPYAYKNRLGFGQIMALVMLFIQLWDIGYYPFQQSDHGCIRIIYWWRTTCKPVCLQAQRSFKKCKIPTL